MAQYLNPYEGIGNALINIGQNYDLDRRRKREAEEDQKRRRDDYKWQSKQEEERANREYERSKPEREMKARLDALRAAELAARTTKAEVEARLASGGKITNLPGGGGSIRQKLDENGNVVEERLPYVPAPERARESRPVVGIDPATGFKTLFNPDTGETVNTGLLASAPPSTEMTPQQRREWEAKRFRSLQDIQKMTDERLAEQYGVDTAVPDGGKAAIAAKRRELEAGVNKFYDQQLGPASPAAAKEQPRSMGAAALGAGAVGQGLMKIGNAVTTTEKSIFMDLQEGRITPEQAQAKLSALTGTRSSITLPGVSVEAQPEAPTPKNEKKPGSSPETAIDATSLAKPPKKGTWIKLPSGKIAQAD